MKLAVLGMIGLTACASTPSSGGTECGPGTEKIGNQCLPVAGDAAVKASPPVSDASSPKPDVSSPACAESFYPDTDKDGFGDRLAVPVCAPMLGYVRDNTDCNDSDDRAFPGQPLYFETSMKGTNPPRFDFNCNEAEDQEFTTVGSTCNNLNCFIVTLGWDSTTPKCGETGSWGSCGTGNCSIRPSSKMQACR